MNANPQGAADLARALAVRAQSLAMELLPQGRREGHEWRCGSLSGEEGKSLAVHLTSTRAGVWSDFASGEAGDALDLVAAVKCGGDMKTAIAWARAWLGQPDGPAPAGNRQRPAPAAEDDDQAARRGKALALFLAAPAALAGSPAVTYLALRGIDLAELGRAPRALRCHPAAWCSEVQRALPAMLAAITNGQGQHIATHRTWLACDDAGRWTKAPLRDAKKTFGSYPGGFIPLQCGASDKPLRDTPNGETVAIAEGIETALSVALACPELRVLSAVSLGNMARIVLPVAVRTVILCADNDGPNNASAARGLAEAVAKFTSEGRQVRVARPPIGKDFNDTLRAEFPA